MKLDAALGTEGNYLREIDRTARAAEDLGFAGLWTSETKHDGFLPLSIAANETSEMELGTSVAIAFSRSPMETAQTAWDLQDLSEGRFLLGLGTQVKAHITRRFSMPWDRPAARLREYILALRDLGVFPVRGAFELRGGLLPPHPHDAVLRPGSDRAARDPDLHRRRQHPPRQPRRADLRRLPRAPVPFPRVREKDRNTGHSRRREAN